MSFITDDHEEFRSAVRKFTDEEISKFQKHFMTINYFLSNILFDEKKDDVSGVIIKSAFCLTALIINFFVLFMFWLILLL